MGIHCHGRFAKGGVEDNIGGLPADPGQCFQCLSGPGYFRAMLGAENPARLDDVLGLGVIQANRFHIAFKLNQAQRSDCFRGVGDGVEFFCGFVDADVCCLGRQDDRYQ